MTERVVASFATSLKISVFQRDVKRPNECPTHTILNESLSFSDTCQALCSSNRPKLLERDALLFAAIVGDLFPGKAVPVPAHDNLQRGIAGAMEAMGLHPQPRQTAKVDQLHETMEVSSGSRKH